MIEQILEIGQRWYNLSQVTEQEKDLMRKANEQYVGKPLGNCPSCFADAYLFFLKYKPTNNQNQMEKQFVLKKGTVLGMHGISDHYTEANMTDEVAIKLLAFCKKNIGHFESYPENWEELVAAEASKTGKTESLNKQPAEEVKTVKKGGKGKKVDFASKPLEELQDFAALVELPEEEWKDLDQAALATYLTEKV